MSYLAESLLREAYRTNAPQLEEAAVRVWREATLLKDEDCVRRFADGDTKKMDTVRNMGIEIPIWLPFELERGLKKAEMQQSSKKRQREAKASEPKDLDAILATLPLIADFRFRPPAQFVSPVYERLEEAAETLRSEVRLPGSGPGPLKRADAVAAVSDSPRGIIELKKRISSTDTPDFKRALAQIAAYIATNHFGSLSVPFVVLTGITGPSGALFTAISGVCILAKDHTGDLFVKEIHHEKKFTEMGLMKKGRNLIFDDEAFSEILCRIGALGEDCKTYCINEDDGSDVNEDQEDDDNSFNSANDI